MTQQWQPELGAVTRSGLLGGFNLFQVFQLYFFLLLLLIYIPFVIAWPSSDNKMQGTCPWWSPWMLVIPHLTICQDQWEKLMNSFQAENNTLLLSTNANPSPGFSHACSFFSMTVSLFIWGFNQIVSRAKNDISTTTRIPGTTIGQVHSFKGLLFSMLCYDKCNLSPGTRCNFQFFFVVLYIRADPFLSCRQHVNLLFMDLFLLAKNVEYP